MTDPESLAKETFFEEIKAEYIDGNLVIIDIPEPDEENE